MLEINSLRSLYILVRILIEQFCTNSVCLSNLLNNRAMLLLRLQFSPGRGTTVPTRGSLFRLFIRPIRNSAGSRLVNRGDGRVGAVENPFMVGIFIGVS